VHHFGARYLQNLYVRLGKERMALPSIATRGHMSSHVRSLTFDTNTMVDNEGAFSDAETTDASIESWYSHNTDDPIERWCFNVDVMNSITDGTCATFLGQALSKLLK
jgi:hypothetical protein